MDRHENEQRVQERKVFLRKIADDLIAQGVLPDDKIVFRAARLELCSAGYFVLSECYKRWRIQEQHNTEPAKIAALTACAIMTFQPFRPTDTMNASTFAEAKCNEIFAASVAAAILGMKIDISTAAWKDFWYRIMDVLHDWNGDTLEPFRTDINLSIPKPVDEYARTVHDRDKAILNSLISIFELLGGKLKP